MTHANARLTFAGRKLIIQRLEAGWTQTQVAEAQGVSRCTVAKWSKRYRLEGDEGLKDRSSRAKHFPHALGEQVVDAICRLRRELGVGPHRIAYELGMQRSTVYAVLKRAGLAVLAHLDRSTRSIIRYERDRPGELIHRDIKKLGRIPDGGGKRVAPGWKETKAARKGPGVGSDYMHIAIDDHAVTPTSRRWRTRKGPPLRTSWCAPPWPSPRPVSRWSGC